MCVVPLAHGWLSTTPPPSGPRVSTDAVHRVNPHSPQPPCPSATAAPTSPAPRVSRLAPRMAPYPSTLTLIACSGGPPTPAPHGPPRSLPNPCTPPPPSQPNVPDLPQRLPWGCYPCTGPGPGARGPMDLERHPHT
jgi:hypothetical protein